MSKKAEFKYVKGTSQWKLAKRNADKLGVIIEPSKRKHKKLDVFDRKGNYLASIGDNRYSDYNYHRDKQRRKRYKSRHENYRHKRNTPSYFADKILW